MNICEPNLLKADPLMLKVALRWERWGPRLSSQVLWPWALVTGLWGSVQAETATPVQAATPITAATPNSTRAIRLS